MPFMFSLLEDGHAFVSGGSFGSETRLRFGGGVVGLTVGGFNVEAGEVGLDLLRYLGVRVAARSASFPFDVFVLFPNIDFRAYYAGDTHGGFVAGSSLTGVRLANCALTGCFEVSLRALTADAWYDIGENLFSMSLGAGGSIGMKL
jgi:hypothetical protein